MWQVLWIRSLCYVFVLHMIRVTRAMFALLCTYHVGTRALNIVTVPACKEIQSNWHLEVVKHIPRMSPNDITNIVWAPTTQWPHMSPNDAQWRRMRPNETQWKRKSPSDTQWPRKSPNDTQWTHMSPNDTQWPLTSPNDTQWPLTSTNDTDWQFN